MFQNSADEIGSYFHLACSECIIVNAVNTVADHAWSWSASTHTEVVTAVVLQPVL